MYTHQSPEHWSSARLVWCDIANPAVRMASSHSDSMMRIFGSPICCTAASVPSVERGTFTIISSHNGNNERMAGTNGYPSANPLRINVKPLIFIPVHQNHIRTFQYPGEIVSPQTRAFPPCNTCDNHDGRKHLRAAIPP